MGNMKECSSAAYLVNCNAKEESGQTIDASSLRTIRTLSAALMMSGLVSIAAQLTCMSIFYKVTRSDGSYNLLETATYTAPGWVGAWHVLLGGVGCIATMWPKRSLFMVTIALAATLIPLSVVALILSGFSFFVCSHLLGGLKFEFVQSLLMVCNSFGFLNAVGVVVRGALALCRANSGDNTTSCTIRSKSYRGYKQKPVRADIIGIRIFSIFTLNLGLLAVIVQTIAWLCLDLTRWFPFYQGFWSGIFNFFIGCLGLRSSCVKTKAMFTSTVAMSSIAVAAAFMSFMLSVLAIFTGYAQCTQNCVLWLSTEWLFVSLSTFAFSTNTVLAVLSSAQLCESKIRTPKVTAAVFDTIDRPLGSPSDSRTWHQLVEQKEKFSTFSTNSSVFCDSITTQIVYYPRTGILAQNSL